MHPTRRRKPSRWPGVVLGSLAAAFASVALWAASGYAGAGAAAEPARRAPEPARAALPDAYESASGTHKLLLRSEDAAGIGRLRNLGVVGRQIDYGSFQ